ncbi:hypothetical protein FAI41_04385 [Acetobacteraceae bacterium]|nr:hypothetical protein FAI41_04385 [Acetobacteraceae bacterium]
MSFTKHNAWEKRFPELCHFFECYLNNMIFEELGQGETTEEITTLMVQNQFRTYSKKVLEQLSELIALIKKGKMDADQFLKEICSEKLYEYDHISTLEWFEIIEKILKENVPKRKKDPLDPDDFED